MKKIILSCSVIALFFCGCATQKMYTWGDYSSSLYKLKKNPCEENLQDHKKVLVSVMEESKEKGLRVPPGICCEYGYILFKEGKQDEAIRYLNLEEQTYPESSVFIKRLKDQIQKKGEKL